MLDFDEGRAREIRIALGGVATVPWRAKEAEAVLRGKEINKESLHAAAEAAFAGARTQNPLCQPARASRLARRGRSRQDG